MFGPVEPVHQGLLALVLRATVAPLAEGGDAARWTQPEIAHVRAAYRLQQSDDEIRAELGRIAGYIAPTPVFEGGPPHDLSEDARHCLLSGEHEAGTEGAGQ